MPGTAHDDDMLGRMVGDAGPVGDSVRDRGMVAVLQEALLPTALPVLPRARIAARYLVAGQEQLAGGDWFDAVPLADGSVALVVGDVVGHGVAAAAAMGQLRAVLTELLAAEADLGRVLRRADAFAARTPALRAATLALAVLDPVGGALRYTTCGHPPPLVIGIDGTARYLEDAGTGPLGTGSPPVLADGQLAPGELVLLYSDGLVERPDRTIAEGMAELAAAAAGAVAEAPAERALALAAELAAAERVCRRAVELLTRTGRVDDITALAAQRLADPVPALRLELPSERPSLTTAREAFAGWLSRLGAAADDADALHLALVEVFTNAIEHAYPRGESGIIELEATLGDDGNVECRVTDHGSWRQPDPADADRGHGLMVAEQLVDRLLVSHPPLGHPTGPADGTAGIRGTIVTLRHRLRPARRPGPGSRQRARRSSGRPALRGGHLHRGKRHGPGAGARPGRHHHRRSAGPPAPFRQPGRHGPARGRPHRRHPAGQRGGSRAVRGQRADGSPRAGPDPDHRAGQRRSSSARPRAAGPHRRRTALNRAARRAAASRPACPGPGSPRSGPVSPVPASARARVRTVLRRTRPETTGPVLTFADLRFDQETYEVRRAGHLIELSPTEFRLLRYLMLNPGRVLTRAQLLDHVWDYDFRGSTTVVSTYVAYLRRKLARYGPDLIHTQRAVGYSLRLPRPGDPDEA